MPETLEIKRLDQRPMTESLLAKNKVKILGLSSDDLIKYFFSGSAWTAIIVLLLITVSLFREGYGFFPQHHESLKLYRTAGLEYVDFVRQQMTAQASLSRYLNEMELTQAAKLRARGLGEEAVKAKLASLEQLRFDFDAAGVEGQTLLNDMTTMAAGIKDRYTISQENKQSRKQLLDAGMKEEADLLEIEEIDLGKEAVNLRSTFEARHSEVSNAMALQMSELIETKIKQADPEYASELQTFSNGVTKLISGFPQVHQNMVAWRYDVPVPWYESVTKFIFGSKWVTQSFWQDWYGFLPLFVGSLTVSVVALVIAVPLGVGAAVYVNQVATLKEQQLIKPFIEFIAVIPSVVLGFFGIAVLGEAIRLLTGVSWLAWVPGFPIPERLNIITCGILLALMAVPSIFTFSEDALNNVPKAYKEASYALGANRMQTIVRIIVPASLSGIISAILLGFGRVIGETMVVLLVAGNRIQIPDFTAGLNFIFQPVHTMTGLVAQELPEVVKDSLQYRALFVLAIVLFLISLLINYLAQIFVRKYKISVG
jgi:phosphate transport system permease protein